MIRRTSIKLIEKAVSEKWIRQLAFFHLLKFRFNNSCIYDYRSRMDEIAKEFNITSRTLYNYLNFLRSKELIYDHADNLIVKSIKDFTNRKKNILILNDNYNLWDITCLLYGKLIERRGRQQSFLESIRRFGRGDRLNREQCETPFRPSFSLRTMAKLLNISEFKANLVEKNLIRLGVVSIEKQKPQLISGNFTELNCIKDYPGYRYNIGGKLFEIFGARVNFLHFPVFLKRISLKQYMVHIKGEK